MPCTFPENILSPQPGVRHTRPVRPRVCDVYKRRCTIDVAGSQRRCQGNGLRNAPGGRFSRPHNTGHNSTPQCYGTGAPPALNVAAYPPASSSALAPVPSAVPGMHYSQHTLDKPVRIRCNLPSSRDGSKTVARKLPTAPLSGYPPSMDLFTQVNPNEPPWRPSRLSHASDPDGSSRADPLTGTLIQGCGKTGQ